MEHERTGIGAASAEDLDWDAIGGFLAVRLPGWAADPGPEELAVRLGLAARMGSRLHPTLVGLMVFGRLPQLTQPHWGVSAVRIGGATMSDPVVAREDLEGPLDRLLTGALGFVGRHTVTLADQVTVGAATEYSEVALREALVNALVHRDYRRTSRVALRIFDDRLELENPGGLLESVANLDDLVQRGGISAPRNPILAATARVLGIGEQLGRGLCLMRRAVTARASQRLLIESDVKSFMVVLPSQHCRPLDARSLT